MGLMSNRRTSYATVADVIDDRIQWSIALLDDLVQRGRSEGWLEGDVCTSGLDHREAARQICERCSQTPPDPLLLPMQWLAIRMQLDGVQAEVLWLLAAIELSPAVTRLVDAFGSPSSPGLTVQLLHQLFPLRQGHLDALDRLALIELSSDPSVPHSRRRVRINDRVLSLLQGELDIDRELRHLATLHAPSRTAPVIVINPAEAPLVVAVGPEGSGRTTALCSCVPERGTLRIRCSALSRDENRLVRQLRAIVRESYLFDVVPVFQELDIHARLVEEELADFVGVVLATSSSIVTWRNRPVVTHELSRPSGDESRSCWREGLETDDSDLIEGVATRYRLWPGAITAACRNVLAAKGTGVDAALVQAGVRAHLGDTLRSVATRIDWKQSWGDLVLPSDQFGQIIELIARVRHRTEVLDDWGFGDKIGKGHGVAALLSGAPGTGKTMVAGLIAKELELDLYQVDLSKIVSKFIGETEKQLGSLFDAAETGQAIILFDEADSLFAKRSEVKTSNDRYANLEVNYLLQRLESFTGIVLLTTNHERSIDEAFRRRLSAHVRFPVPDESQRQHLWRAMLPTAAKVADDIDFDRLASEFDLSGGYIRNAVLRAAYLAAYEKAAISMRHMWTAARIESESLGRIVQRVN